MSVADFGEVDEPLRRSTVQVRFDGGRACQGSGVVHAVGPLRGVGNQNWVQASIRLAPGNSGGQLANSEGEVVPFVERALLPPAPPILGITAESVELQVAAQRAVGLRVQHSEPGGRAQVASLLPGDVIIGIDVSTLERRASASRIPA